MPAPFISDKGELSLNKSRLCTAALALTLAFGASASAAGTTSAGTSTPGTTTVNTTGTYTGAQNMSGPNASYPGNYGKADSMGTVIPGPYNTGTGINRVNEKTTEINRMDRSVDRNGNGALRSTYTNQTPGNGRNTANMSSYRVGMATRADNTMDYGWLGLLGLIGLAGLRSRKRNDDPTR